MPGTGEAMRAAQAAVKAAEHRLRLLTGERKALELHLLRTDPARERRARHLEGGQAWPFTAVHAWAGPNVPRVLDPSGRAVALRRAERFELPDLRQMSNAEWTTYGEPQRVRCGRRGEPGARDITPSAHTGRAPARGPSQILALANHWKVIPDVLPPTLEAAAATGQPGQPQSPYLPTVNLVIEYPDNELVYRGNLLTPTQVRSREILGSSTRPLTLCAPPSARLSGLGRPRRPPLCRSTLARATSGTR